LHEQGIVLAQEPIDSNEPADKAEAELTVAPALLARLDWHGRVMTGDALFCQRNLCQQVVQAGGDYLLLVKDNQPTLREDIRLLFEPPADSLPLDDRREARTVEDGHGRHHETRHLIASTDLLGYSDWPSLAQVFRIERTWQEHGTTKREVHYGVTSLPPDIADADRLLALRRGHWQIENALNHVKDVTMGEDRSLVHLDNGPSVMAMLRDLSISLLRRVGCRTIAKRLRHNSRHPEGAVALLAGISP
jgi:predicted transposase YbfD/YdcC